MENKTNLEKTAVRSQRISRMRYCLSVISFSITDAHAKTDAAFDRVALISALALVEKELETGGGEGGWTGEI